VEGSWRSGDRREKEDRKEEEGGWEMGE